MRAIPQLVSALLNLSNKENIKFKATCRLWLGARQCYSLYYSRKHYVYIWLATV